MSSLHATCSTTEPEVDGENDDGWTALSFAARWDARLNEMVALLLASGADPNHRTRDGWTPLLLATHDRVVTDGPFRVLLAAERTDVNAAGALYGWTALTAALRRGCPELVETLLARGADPNLRMRVAPARPPAPTASVLARNLWSEIRVGAKLDGYTALLWAAKKDRGAVVERLCAAGADPNARSTAGETALSLARGKNLRAFLASRA